MEMMLMGEPISAEQALQIGLVTCVTETDNLMTELERRAAHLATFAPFVPQFMKLMVHKGMEGSKEAALAMEKMGQGALLQTEDKNEGIDAFLTKRKPVFKGK
jgi:enoyl-CoA hydratase/carnithine racemase